MDTKQLKITKENFDYLASGLKPYELRAMEKVGDGGEFMLVDSVSGEELGKIELFKLANYYTNSSLPWDNYFGTKDDVHFSYLMSTPFWKPWVEHYLTKGETPAFYQVLNLEIIKTDG